MRIKSASPCTITLRSLFSMMFGSTVRPEGRLASPRGKTSTSLHSDHVTFVGAWMALFTSARSKYSGETCVCGNEPLDDTRERHVARPGRRTHGNPRTSQRIGYCGAR